MRALSKEAENKLISAIERAAALVNEGATPNAAIIKSASDANIPAGHINLMVHAYNTGRTTKQREQGESATEKSADFQLADANAVMSALYPAQVKTSAELVRDSIVSTEYAVSPAGFIARRNADLQKAAAAQTALPAPTFVPAPRDEHSAARRTYSQKMAEKRAAEELRRVASVAYQKAAVDMEAVCQYFRVPGNMSFGDALRETGLRLGDEGVAVLKRAAAVYPQLEKQADTGTHHFGDKGPYALVQNVLESLEAYNEAQGRVVEPKTASAEIGKKNAPTFITDSILYDPKTAPLALKVAAVVDKKPKKSEGAPSAPLNSFGGAMASLGKVMGPGAALAKSDADTDPSDQKRKAFMSMSGADHENKLQQIKSRGVLNDLILNDPVISGYDPAEIATAYNQIAEMAPNFTGQSAAMQALLRKRLEAGQLADFDVKQLIEMEKLRAESLKSNLEAQQKARELL
jgi:hypothetical protein